MNKAKLTLLFFAIVCFNKAFGWGRDGHRIVALIAKSQVNKEVVSLVKQYLNGMSWEDAACWMDDVKSVAGSEFMKEWHYLNFPKDKTSVKSKNLNIVTQLEYYLKILRNHEMYSKEMVFEALKIVFHLTGDLSQPLHCGYVEDKGGNLTSVKFLNKASNLHHVWDSQIIEEKKLDIWACSKTLLALSEEEKKACQVINLNSWINESKNLLKDVYEINNGVIDLVYIDKNSELIKKQLVKAGLHLAAILEANFKERI